MLAIVRDATAAGLSGILTMYTEGISTSSVVTTKHETLFEGVTYESR